jgi:hypothetical protein
MPSSLPVFLDLERGAARLGGVAVALPRAAGGVRVGGAGGPVLRTLTFGERNQLVSACAPEELARRIDGAALVEPGAVEPDLQMALALALAGGAVWAPSFVESGRLVMAQQSWTAAELEGAAALTVDRLAERQPDQVGGGWRRIVFQAPTPEWPMAALVAAMVENLRSRALAVEAVGLPDVETSPVATAEPPEAVESRQTRALDERRSSPAAAPAPRPPVPARPPAAPSRRPTPATTPPPAPAVAATGRPSTIHAAGAPAAGRTSPSHSARPAPAPVTRGGDRPSTSAGIATRTPTTATPPRARKERPLASAVLRPHAAVARATPPPARVPTAPQSPIAAVIPTPWTRPPPALPDADAPVARPVPPTTDWITELAAGLERECDLRGID